MIAMRTVTHAGCASWCDSNRDYGEPLLTNETKRKGKPSGLPIRAEILGRDIFQSTLVLQWLTDGV